MLFPASTASASPTSVLIFIELAPDEVKVIFPKVPWDVGVTNLT